MVVLSKVMGANRDMPQTETYYQASATAGTGTDYEHSILAIPDLTKMLLATGEAGDLPQNSIYIRNILIVPEATITGAATNNMLLAIRQYRAGVPINFVNTTCGTSISVGANTLTPASMQFISVGDMLFISAGTGTAEFVTVTAATTTTFTFTAANTHSGAYTITSNYLCAILFANGTNATAFTPLQAGSGSFIANVTQNVFKAGDVLTVQRLSFGTGLASPSFMVVVEWASLGGPATAPFARG